MRRRIMYVPFGNTEVEHDSRLHEMGHGTWSPEDLKARILAKHEVHDDVIQAVEDARINTNLRNIGLELRSSVLREVAMTRLESGMSSQTEKLLMLCGTRATGDELPVRRALAKSEEGMQVLRFADMVLRVAGFEDEEGFVIDDEATDRVIEMLMQPGGNGEGGVRPNPNPGSEQGGPQGEAEPQQGQDEQKGGSGTNYGSSRPEVKEFDLKNKPERTRSQYEAGAITRAKEETKPKPDEDRADKQVEMQADAVQALQNALEATTDQNDGVRPVPSHLLDNDGPPVSHGRKRPEDEVEAYGGWCSMRIIEPARPNRVPARVRGRAKGVNDQGAIPIAMHRATSDGRVFRAARIKPMAGAVLIDNSGSMGFEPEDLITIMQHLPAATIADYCANSHRGELRILAHNGRMVRDEILRTKIGSSNGVDGPALRWLVQQKGPRFWIADGAITGQQDTPIVYGGEECLVLCKAGRVIQLTSIDKLEALLESGKLSLRRHPPLRAADQPRYRIKSRRVVGGWLG
jgi:hypothetical protein